MSPIAGTDAVEALVALAKASSAPADMSCKVIAIDGPGGAGKSTLAARVARLLDDAPVIHTDDFASRENPLDWWPRMLEQVLVPLSTARAECLRRGLERDGPEAADAWKECQAAEDRYVEQHHPERVVDLVVSGEDGQPWTGPRRPDRTHEP